MAKRAKAGGELVLMPLGGMGEIGMNAYAYGLEHGKGERCQMTLRKLSLYHSIKVKAVGMSVVPIRA